jgi:hypothetical protein
MNEQPSPSQKKNPYEAIGIAAWKRGMWLGFLLIALFGLGALGGFFLAGLTGLDVVSRAILGAIAGPVFGTALFAYAVGQGWVKLSL